jgi:hypothetical protein
MKKSEGSAGIPVEQENIGGCWAAFTHPASPYLSHYHGNVQRASQELFIIQSETSLGNVI